MTDPIADYLTRIRNAIMRSKQEVYIPFSRTKQNISNVLKKKGFIDDYEILPNDGKPLLKVVLKYDETGKSVISELKRVSKPGRRVYLGYRDIPRVKAGFGAVIVSTSKGVVSGQEARKMQRGGELLCTVW